MSFVTLDQPRQAQVSDDRGFKETLPDIALGALILGGLWLWVKSSGKKKSGNGIEMEPIRGSGRHGRGG